MAGGPQRRRHDDDDDESEAFDDDDLESLASTQVDGLDKRPAAKPEEELELPAYACS
jgi:regulator of nonsense transcripts 1